MIAMSPDVKGDSVPAKRTRREQAQDTRVRIMLAAQTVFAEKGYSGARMADIAREAGVAVQTVYFAFHTKPELVQACYERAVLGPDELPPHLQPWYADAMAAGSGVAAVGHFARGNAAIVERVALIDDVARSAAHEPRSPRSGSGPRTCAATATARSWRASEDRFGLRDGLEPERAVDLVMTLAGQQVYLQLRSYGWTHEELRRVVDRDASAAGTPPTGRSAALGRLPRPTRFRSMSTQPDVAELARRARVASRELALATRAVKDAALLAMADALDRRTDEVLAANADDVRTRRGGRHAGPHGRPAAADRRPGRRRWPRGCATWPACPTRSARWSAAARWPTGWSCARCGCRSAWSG